MRSLQRSIGALLKSCRGDSTLCRTSKNATIVTGQYAWNRRYWVDWIMGFVLDDFLRTIETKVVYLRSCRVCTFTACDWEIINVARKRWSYQRISFNLTFYVDCFTSQFVRAESMWTRTSIPINAFAIRKFSNKI